MSIKEIWVPEALATLFLLLPLLRTFIEKLRYLDGISWLPLIALGILVGIFPAYGFRLEVIPILIFAIFFNLSNLFSFVANKLSRPTDTLHEIYPFRTILAMLLLVATAVPMFAFTPRHYFGIAREPEEVRTVAVPRVPRGNEYVLRIYGPVQAERPLIFLVPPEIGSAASVELICESLREKGFTVVTYFRRDHDTLFVNENGRRRAFPGRLLRYMRVFRRGTDSASVNKRGRALEDARKRDLEFLLPRLPALLEIAGPEELPPTLFVGYGAGGSALAFMAEDGGFLTRNSDALGVIAIESRLWSSFQGEPHSIEPLTTMGAMARLWTNIANWFRDLRPQRLSRTGPLPETGLPTLHLVSGRALDADRGPRAYQAIFDALRFGGGPVALAAIESAGPLDYQDYPLTQPMLSFFMRGLRNAPRSENHIGDTAGIIGNFASFLLEQRQAKRDEIADDEFADLETAGTIADAEPEPAQNAPAVREIQIPPRSAITGPLHIERGGILELHL